MPSASCVMRPPFLFSREQRTRWTVIPTLSLSAGTIVGAGSPAEADEVRHELKTLEKLAAPDILMVHSRSPSAGPITGVCRMEIPWRLSQRTLHDGRTMDRGINRCRRP